jgi:hypothetical protein
VLVLRRTDKLTDEVESRYMDCRDKLHVVPGNELSQQARRLDHRHRFRECRGFFREGIKIVEEMGR